MSWIFSLPRVLENFISLGSPGLVFKPTNDSYELKLFSDDENNKTDKANTVWSQRAIEAYLAALASPGGSTPTTIGLGIPNPIITSMVVPGGYQAIWYRELAIADGATLTVYGEAIIL